MISRSIPRACAGVLILGLLLVFSVGCGPDYRARGTVKGKVTFANKTLTVGSVMFTSVRNEAYTGSASIDKNGNYIMTDAPVGEVKVTVSVPKLPPGGIARMKGGPSMMKDKKDKGESVNPDDPSKRIAIMGDMPDNVVPIPEKFASTETSGLTFTVKRGEQTYNITLTP